MQRYRYWNELCLTKMLSQRRSGKLATAEYAEDKTAGIRRYSAKCSLPSSDVKVLICGVDA
jgi:hypothetical protein